jgi:hypothetical protein
VTTSPINMEKRERYIATLIALLHQFWLGDLDQLIERIRHTAIDPVPAALYEKERQPNYGHHD